MSTSFREKAEFTAAQMYYVQNRTMEHIAHEMGVSRSTVSRLLREAREQGIVRISVHPPMDRASALEHQLSQLFGVNAHVAQAGTRDSAAHRADATAVLAAAVLDQLVEPNSIVGLAWGATMTSVVRRLQGREVPGVQAVQLNGAVNSQPEFMDSPSGINLGMGVVEHFARAYDGRAHLFAVPAFFDYEQTKQALWRERSTRRILNMQRRVSLAVFGVGTFSGGAPSQVYSEGYLSREDLDQLNAERAVGDVCTVFLRGDGSWRDIELNSRCSGMPPDVLRRIPRRLCVVNSPHKVAALRAVLEVGLVTDLVLDQSTASALAHGR